MRTYDTFTAVVTFLTIVFSISFGKQIVLRGMHMLHEDSSARVVSGHHPAIFATLKISVLFTYCVLHTILSISNTATTHMLLEHQNALITDHWFSVMVFIEI